jgi:hypothetical protein
MGIKKTAKKKNKEEFDIKEIYTPLSVVKKEIWKRWNDKELRKKVEDFLGGDIPKILRGKEPGAVLSRDVISPNKEFFYFLDLLDDVKMNPAFLEYLDGKFVAKNFNKYHLCRMFFYNGRGKNGGDKISTLKVVNFNTMEGKKIKHLKTIGGENFVDFHHKILEKNIPKKINIGKICDISHWFNKHRKMSKYYYLRYLALFLCHGILFDNFITKNGEGDFTEKKIIPSFKKLEKIFGIKPLVVPLTPIEDESELYWWCYPAKIEKNARERIGRKKG